MAATDPHSLPRGIPGDALDAARMPGHWLLARLGKRVLRPGGVELTRWMLDNLALRPDDRVVELAAGLGATARLAVARKPGSFTAVDRDPAAVAGLGTLTAPGATEMMAVRADAADTGLPTGSATVVYGEAMLTMQPDPAKRRIVREARRLLTNADSRYAIHELCLLPEDLDQEHAEAITRDLGEAIHVGARPLENADGLAGTPPAHSRRGVRAGRAHRWPGPARPRGPAPRPSDAPRLPPLPSPPRRHQPHRHPHPVPALRGHSP